MDQSFSDHLECLLDRALAETFPASDPIAVHIPEEAERQPPACDN